MDRPAFRPASNAVLWRVDFLLLVRPTGSDAFRRSHHVLAASAGLLLGARHGCAADTGGSLRVLFLDQFSDLGGAQLCLRDVLLEVKRLGWQADVMAPGAGPLLSFAQDLGMNVQRLPLAGYANGHKSASDVFRYGIDMVQSAHMLRRALRQR